MKTKTTLLIIGISAIAGAGVLAGPLLSRVEQASYTVVEKHGDIEVRDYAATIVAEVEVAGERESAINEGFRILARYIFGGNTTQAKVAMTAPVIQQPNVKIAMTAPVTQSGRSGKWVVRFVMPASYTLETLPKPLDNSIQLKKLGAARFVVIRFSGMARTASLEKHRLVLQEFMSSKGVQPKSQPTYAFFNPPWTLPFFRRNEIMIEIDQGT